MKAFDVLVLFRDTARPSVRSVQTDARSGSPTGCSTGGRGGPKDSMRLTISLSVSPAPVLVSTSLLPPSLPPSLLPPPSSLLPPLSLPPPSLPPLPYSLTQSYLYGERTDHVTYTDFINKELILFSNMDNERSIASAVDGKCSNNS